MRKVGLPPVVDEETEILILGTFPSDMSIAAAQYYANLGNDFWKLVGEALDESFVGLPYEAKIELLKANRIGLWDAYHSCIRLGSMDGNITGQELNDFGSLKSIAPKIGLICFNGKEAAKADETFSRLNYQTVALPSSSGSNRTNQAQRLNLWKVVIPFHTFTPVLNSKYNSQSQEIVYRLSLSPAEEGRRDVVRTYWSEEALGRALGLLDLPRSSIERALLVLAKNDFYPFPDALRLNDLQFTAFALSA